MELNAKGAGAVTDTKLLALGSLAGRKIPNLPVPSSFVH